MTSKFDELVAKLTEIFQIDKPELDFGVYKILHARADEIKDFLTNKLKVRVQATLQSHGNATAQASFDAAKNAVVTNFGAGAIKQDGTLDPLYAASPLGQKYAEARQALSAAAGTLQNESVVYSHLLDFFGRYYEDGDFISKRRYKEGVYAIPYSGEEVKLHWANADQYYTKSGENFTNYSFTLEGGAKVHFVLVSAETAKDNIKDNDAVRRFVLFDPAKQVEADGPRGARALPGDGRDRAPRDPDDDGRGTRPACPQVPLEETNGELSIYFQYLKVPKGKSKNVVTKEPTSQKDFIAAALPVIQEKLNADTALALKYAKLFQPISKDDKRTYLEKHLTDYTEKNTRDYFIHKDLKGFLERELDFYVKSEMMHLDRIDEAETIKDLEANLRVIQAFRSIALVLIGFMAQLEDFQKKLYLKKKFVTSCEYCITMDRLSDALRAEALANPKQQAEWKKWGIDADPKASDMMAVDARMVDTKFFVQSDGSNPFKDRLLKEIDSLDDQCDGLLIHADNFQALRFICERYRGEIQCIYIDPPYNADATCILYKNGYRYSSWNTLMSNRIPYGKSLMRREGICCTTIDDYELYDLKKLLDGCFGEHNFLANVVIRNNPSGRSTVAGFAICHEYGLFYANDIHAASISRLEHSQEQKDRYNSKDINGHAFEWENLRKSSAGSYRADRPKQFFPIYFSSSNKTLRVPNCTWDDAINAYQINDSMRGDEIEVLPIDGQGRERVWAFGIERVRKEVGEIIYKIKEGKVELYKRKWLHEEGTLPRTWWDSSEYSARDNGSRAIANLFGSNRWFDFPKAVDAVKDSLRIGSLSTGQIGLDYFGGSGTTAHAVIALNREDKGHRKYILVEMGDHFDTVLKPRIEKVVYSPEWKDGKPVSSTRGISHCFKYLTLESYEDTLNNLELKRTGVQEQGLLQFKDDAYLLKYMLDVESRGSVISTDDFRKPFDYELKIAYESSGAAKKQKIDLVETFNYLIGLKVDQYVREVAKGYAYCDGTLPSGEHALVFWRDCEKVDAKALNEILEKLDVKAGVKAGFDVLYVNGDHAVQNGSVKAADGAAELKVRQIESEFLDKMFAGEES